MDIFIYERVKKGLLSENDKKKRRVYARDTKRNILKREPDFFFTNGVRFYLDGVSFVHKTNPCDGLHANQKVESGEKKAKDCKSLQREAKNLAGGRPLAHNGSHCFWKRRYSETCVRENGWTVFCQNHK